MPPNAYWDPLITRLLIQQLATGRHACLVMTTMSMAPLLKPGDHVVLAAVTCQSLQRGDIVVLAALPRPLVHRLVAVIGNESGLLLVTKGDCRTTYDRPLAPRTLLGRVVAVERAGRLLALTARTARFAARLLAALSCLCASTTCLRPRRLRCATFWLLRLAICAVAEFTWRTARVDADSCATFFKLRQ